jgi:hypothetical protein
MRRAAPHTFSLTCVISAKRQRSWMNFENPLAYAAYAKLIGTREIHPRTLWINPYFEVKTGFISPKYAQIPKQWWRGVPPFLGPWTSTAANGLVGGPCIRN